jgi:hypothetical protein
MNLQRVFLTPDRVGDSGRCSLNTEILFLGTFDFLYELYENTIHMPYSSPI